MRRGQSGGDDKKWSFDPRYVENIPQIMEKLVVYDEYFEEEDPLTILANIVDQLLIELPEELAGPVNLVTLNGMSYRSAGEALGIDHKTVKRRVEQGLAVLRERLLDTAWIASMLTGMLPEEAEAPRLETSKRVVEVLNSLKEKEVPDETDDN